MPTQTHPAGEVAMQGGLNIVMEFQSGHQRAYDNVIVRAQMNTMVVYLDHLLAEKRYCGVCEKAVVFYFDPLLKQAELTRNTRSPKVSRIATPPNSMLPLVTVEFCAITAICMRLGHHLAEFMHVRPAEII